MKNALLIGLAIVGVTAISTLWLRNPGTTGREHTTPPSEKRSPDDVGDGTPGEQTKTRRASSPDSPREVLGKGVPRFRSAPSPLRYELPGVETRQPDTDLPKDKHTEAYRAAGFTAHEELLTRQALRIMRERSAELKDDPSVGREAYGAKVREILNETNSNIIAMVGEQKFQAWRDYVRAHSDVEQMLRGYASQNSPGSLPDGGSR